MGTLRMRAGPALTIVLLFAAFAGIAWLRYQREQEDLPTGSSYSNESDGARALFLWLEAAGARVGRLEGNQSVVRAQPDTLFLVQPGFSLGTTGRIAFDDVAARGGTLVLVGHSPTLIEYASELGIETNFLGAVIDEAATVASSSSRLTVPVRTRVSLDGGAGAQTLLQAPDGRVVALRKPYRRGTLIVVSSPLPLTNAGLRDGDTARFVYRELVVPVAGGVATSGAGSGGRTVLFDESLHADPRGGVSPDASLTDRILRYVLTTPLGWAAVYGGMLLFLYLLLSGRRLGPALRPARAEAASRTMYEHVQAMAGLYRRGGQFLALRAHFSTYYRRRVGRALGTAAVFGRPLGAAELVERGLSESRAAAISSSVSEIDAARRERDLAEAVRKADGAMEGLRDESRPSRAKAPAGPTSYPQKVAA